MALELGLKLSANTSGFTGAINNASKALSDVLAKSLVEARSSLDQLDPAIRQAVEGIDMMNFTEVSAAMDKFVSDGNLLSGFLERLKGQLGSVDDNEAFTELSQVIQLAEQRLKELDSQEKQNTNSSKSLKAQLKEMKTELAIMIANGEKGSQAFIDLSEKAGILQDAIGDVNEQIKTNASDTQALDAGVQIVNGLVGAYQAYQGAVSLLGIENEDSAKTMQKLMAIMNVAQGIQQIGILLTGQSAAKKVLDTAATYAQSTAYRVLTVSMGASATAARILSAVLATTGVGALIVGLSIAVSKLLEFASSADKAKEAQDALQASLDYQYGQVESRIKLYDRQAKLETANAKARGASEKELEDIEENRIRKKLGALSTLVRDQTASGTILKKAEEDLVNTKLELDTYLAERTATLRETITKKNQEELKKQDTAQKEFNKKQLQNSVELQKELDSLKKNDSDYDINLLQQLLDEKRSKQIAFGSKESADYTNLQNRLYTLKLKRIDDEFESEKKKLQDIGDLTVGKGKEALDKLQEITDKKKIQLQFELKPATTFNSADIEKGVTDAFGSTKIEANIGFEKLVANALGAKQSITSVQDKAIELANTLQNTLGNAFNSVFDSIVSGSQDAFQSFTSAIRGIIINLAKAALQAAIFAAIISIAFPGAGTFATQFGSVFGKISGIKLPKLAEGGLVTAPTLGIIGEAGKEAIIPLDRIGEVLGTVGGSQNVFVTGQLSGETIYLQQQRVSQRRGRFV